ncbi:MAG: class I SAM-dependent methyltransferase [Euzebya sp.]
MNSTDDPGNHSPRYDSIGRSYAAVRRQDPRIAAEIWDAIGDAGSVINVGAGTGNYEPPQARVVAVEPSTIMIGQRPTQSGPVVQATAESLPVADDSFDVALAILTIHHWSDLHRGLAELRRVARRQVVLYFEPLRTRQFWVLEYFPEVVEVVPTERSAPGERELRQALEVSEIRTVMVPHDCQDGFGAAYWARPEAYLDPTVQAGMSWLALLPEDLKQAGTSRLQHDLATGGWDRRHGHLRHQQEFDGGYRLALAGP